MNAHNHPGGVGCRIGCPAHGQQEPAPPPPPTGPGSPSRPNARDSRHAIWLEAAEQDLHDGVNWPMVVRSLFADLEAMVAEERTRWAGKFADNAHRAQAGLEEYIKDLREQLATRMLNTVDPLLPGHEARMQCVQIVRGDQ